MDVQPDEVNLIGIDPNIFEAFYREYVDDVQHFVARRVYDVHLAADLTADVFLSAIDSAHQFRSERGEPRAWLLGIARNVVAAERRRGFRRDTAMRRICGQRLLEPDDVSRLEDRLDAESQARSLYLSMDRLSEGDRAVLELVALEGLTVKDAARALGIRAGAAESGCIARASLCGPISTPSP